jgi:hypothetical protein
MGRVELTGCLAGVRRVYVAGPMSGYDEYNFPAFREACESLRSLGLDVVSPHELDNDEPVPGVVPGDDTYNSMLARDVQTVADESIDAVVVLPGWELSRGALIETNVAHALGKPIVSYPMLLEIRFESPSWEPPDRKPDESVLEEAERLVGGDRQSAYGHPIEDFTRTGILWGGLLPAREAGEPVPPALVGMMMVALKLSRECNRPKRDNLTDAAGYVRTVEMVREREREGMPCGLIG